MSNLNKVFIMGRLGQDPELKYTQNQMAVATLNVATTEYRTGKDGMRQEQTEWHRIVVWNKQAENCQKYLSKGRMVFVEGRLQTRSWDDAQSGQKRYATEIIATSVQFIGGAGGSGAASSLSSENSFGSSSSQGFSGSNFSSTPQFPHFDSQQPSGSSSYGMSQFGGADLDDIPF